MVKLEQKESLDSKLSDLVKFSKLSCLTCLCGTITFSSFLNLILVQFSCMTMQIEAYNCSNFWHIFGIFGRLIGPPVAKLFHRSILVEEVLSFNLSGLTSKSNKNCFQK